MTFINKYKLNELTLMAAPQTAEDRKFLQYVSKKAVVPINCVTMKELQIKYNCYGTTKLYTLISNEIANGKLQRLKKGVYKIV